MKLYGYTDRPGTFHAESPDTLSEATLVASPAALRRLAEFLLFAANTGRPLNSWFAGSDDVLLEGPSALT